MAADTLSLSVLRKRPHWSYSSINTLLNICPLQWAFGHVYRAEPQFTSVFFVFGRCFHDACTFAARLLIAGRPAPPATVADLFGDLLRQECAAARPPVRFCDGETVDSLAAQGARMLEVFLRSRAEDETLTAVAVPFCVVLRDAAGDALKRPLIGEYDCIAERDGVPVIVDWKTAARRWPAAKAAEDLQPTCYLYAWRENGGDRRARFRFDVVTKAAAPAFDSYPAVRGVDDFERLAEKVQVLEELVARDLFLPNDQGWACGSCPYSAACRNWHSRRAAARVPFSLSA